MRWYWLISVFICLCRDLCYIFSYLIYVYTGSQNFMLQDRPKQPKCVQLLFMFKPPWPRHCKNSPTCKRFGRTSIFHTLSFAKLTYFSVGLDFLLLVQNSLFCSAIPRCVPSPFCSFFTWSPFNFRLHEVAHELGLGSGGAPAANTLCLNLEPTQ